MKTIDKLNSKRHYCTPEIERIELDKEISLQLESPPPGGPPGTETFNSSPEYINNSPFKDNNFG